MLNRSPQRGEGCHKSNILDTVRLADALHRALSMSKHYSNVRSQRFVYVEQKLKKSLSLMSTSEIALTLEVDHETLWRTWILQMDEYLDTK